MSSTWTSLAGARPVSGEPVLPATGLAARGLPPRPAGGASGLINAMSTGMPVAVPCSAIVAADVRPYAKRNAAALAGFAPAATNEHQGSLPRGVPV